MRLSEKSIELNFCAGVSRHHSRPVHWFGLTQRQEAVAGFDVATRLGARVVCFQVKASNHVLKRSHARRFKAPHDQLTALQQRAKRHRSIYYLLPDFGDTVELAGLRDPLGHMWLLDVADLPAPMPPPTKGTSRILRKSGWHYVDMVPPHVTVHSEPVTVPVRNAIEHLPLAFGEGVGLRPANDDEVWTEEGVSEIGRLFSGRAVGAVLL